MKAREVIHQLLESTASDATIAAVTPLLAADGGLDGEVCVHNADIHFIDADPAYYDGAMQRLIRDESKTCYNITGAEYIGEGTKLVIHVLTVNDALWDDPELPVDCSRAGGSRRYYEERVAATRAEVRRAKQDMQNELFVKWVERKLGSTWSEDHDEAALKAAALAFAEAELPFTMAVDPDLHQVTTELKTGHPTQPTARAYLSWNDKRERHWDRHVQLDLTAGQLRLRYTA